MDGNRQLRSWPRASGAGDERTAMRDRSRCSSRLIPVSTVPIKRPRRQYSGGPSWRLVCGKHADRGLPVNSRVRERRVGLMRGRAGPLCIPTEVISHLYTEAAPSCADIFHPPNQPKQNWWPQRDMHVQSSSFLLRINSALAISEPRLD